MLLLRFPMALAPQRFSTDTCVLEVVGQDSALSRWTAQPVVKRLRFRLWLSTGAVAPLLLAQGDLSQLEALRQTVQQTIQSRLVLPRLQITDSGSFSLALGPPPGSAPQPIIGGQLRSLSHLHLCDIAAVLNQYEQQLAAVPQGVVAAAPNTARRPLSLWIGSAASVLLAVGGAAALWPRPSLFTANQAPAEESASPVESAEAPSGSPSAPGASPFKLGSAEPNADSAASSRLAAPAPAPPRPSTQPAAPGLNSAARDSLKPTSPSSQTRSPSATAPSSPALSSRAAEEADIPPDIATAEAEPDSSGSERLQLLETTREVQQYFQAQWQANQTEQPLVYLLQLNPDGSVAAFGSVSAEAAAYRDRITLPNTEIPTFSPVPQSQPLNLRIELQPNGRVQVVAE